MADIARLAGVAVSTVSRALAGSPLVNQETRDRVTELARSLNYSVNVRAQSLRLKQNNTVSVILPYDASTAQHFSDPFFLTLIGSLGDAITERGFEMLLSRIDAEHLDLAAQPYLSGRAMGVVLVGQWHHHDQLDELAVRRVPLVVWGALMPQQLYCTVGSDNVQGGRIATEHLFAQGARRIGFLGDTTLPEVAQRHDGYVSTHVARRVPIDGNLTRPVPFGDRSIDADVKSLLRHEPRLDGIFASSDLLAIAAIGELHRQGKRVPDDVAVVGYDDIALARYCQPPLTTVRQPIEAAGKALLDMLMAQLAGERPLSVQLQTELVQRATTRAVALPTAARTKPASAASRRSR